MTQKTHNDNHNPEAPAEAQSEGPDPGDKVFEALARLRGVRRLGAGKLSLDDAIATAIEQAKAYERWIKHPTPVQRVQVWVEGLLVITIAREDASAKLKGFDFAVESPRDAVMQIVKADEGEEPVVLRNLPLSTVPLSGTEDKIDLPNHKNITMHIKPETAGKFDVQVAFGPLAWRAGADGGSSRTESVSNRRGPNTFGVWLGTVVILLGLMLRMAFPLFGAQTANAERLTTKVDVEQVRSNSESRSKRRSAAKPNSTSSERRDLTTPESAAALISQTTPAPEQRKCVNCDGARAIAESSMANAGSNQAVAIAEPKQLVAGELRGSNETAAKNTSVSELPAPLPSPSRDVSLATGHMGAVAIIRESSVVGDRSVTPKDRTATGLRSTRNETSFAGSRRFGIRPN